MIKKLAVPLFALGLAVWGCSEDKPKKKDAGSSEGGSGGSAGSGGSGGRGGSGGSAGSGGSGGMAGAGGTGGARDAAAGGSGGSDAGMGGTGGARDAAAGGAGGAAGRDGGTTDGSTTPRDGGSSDSGRDGAAAAFCPRGNTAATAADFCAQYLATCMFGAGANKYADMADCMTKYNAAASANKTCRADHVCNAVAASGATRTMHCEHSTGTGPCAP